jgi:hypothetical protein
MTKHTQGPWFAEGSRIVSEGNRNLTIARVGVAADGDYSKDNAKLVAAAPDMLEALEYCKSWFEKYSPTAELISGKYAPHPMLICIDAAIAKAKGE